MPLTTFKRGLISIQLHNFWTLEPLHVEKSKVTLDYYVQNT